MKIVKEKISIDELKAIGNRSRSVDDPFIRKNIIEIVKKLVKL